MLIFKKIFFTLIFLTTSLISFSADESIFIETAMKKGLLSVKIFGKGGYLGDVIGMKIKNLQNHPVAFSVEAGRRLDSKDSVQQDILITKSVTMSLLANETQTVTISGMCCQAHNHSPMKDEVYRIGKMADSNLIKIARFIDENKWYDNYIAQNAVWIISDNERMENIGGEDEVSKKLQQFVSKLTGKPIPKYRINYESDTASAFSGRAEKISGTFEYDLFNYGTVTFGIYDKDGHAVQMFFNEVPKNVGHHVFNYEFKTSYLPKGNYYARLRLDGQVIKEEKFTF